MAGYGAPPPGGPYGGPPSGPYGGAPGPYGGAPGPYGPPAGGAYPPQPDPLFQHFSTVAGSDGQISAQELQRALSATGIANYPRPGDTFSLETCRLMISMLDHDFTGSMGFNEFKELHNVIEQWKQAFARADTDRSGSIEHAELRAALQSFGYNLSDNAIQAIIRRYSKRGYGQILFDDFMACIVKIRALTDAFRRRDAGGQGYATLYYDDFMTVVMGI